MSNFLKIVFSLFFCLGVFVLPGLVHASPLDQLQSDGTITGMGDGGGGSNSWYPVVFYDFATSTVVSDISLFYAISNSTCPNTNAFKLILHDDSGWQVDSSPISGSNQNGLMVFNFSTTTPTQHGYFEWFQTAYCESNYLNYNYTAFTYSSDTAIYSRWSTILPKFYLNYTGGGGTASYSIELENLPQNILTPDFKTWQASTTFANITLPKIYSVGVKYKQASSTDWQFEDLLSKSSLSNENYSTTFDLNKNFNLIPGDYIAEAQLYSDGKTAFSTNIYNPATYHWTLLATSTLYSFTVATSTQWGGGMIPKDLNATSTTLSEYCPETSFSLSFFSGYSVDFGQGLCKLFVPDPNAFSNLEDVRDLLGTKLPFSYFYEITNSFTILSPSSSSMSSLNLTVGTSTAPIYFTFTAFSSSTMSRYASNGSLTTLRTVIQWGLYLSFISMIIWEVRRLFDKGNNKK